MVVSKSKIGISVLIDKEVKALLEKHAQYLDLTLSKFARNLMYIALDDAKLIRKTGAFKVLVPFRDLLEKIPSYKHEIEKKIADFEANSVTITVIIDADIKETIEKIADELGLPLKTFARNLIYVGLDQFKLLDNVGLARVAVAFEKLLETFHSFSPETTQRKPVKG